MALASGPRLLGAGPRGYKDCRACRVRGSEPARTSLYYTPLNSTELTLKPLFNSQKKTDKRRLVSSLVVANLGLNTAEARGTSSQRKFMSLQARLLRSMKFGRSAPSMRAGKEETLVAMAAAARAKTAHFSLHLRQKFNQVTSVDLTHVKFETKPKTMRPRFLSAFLGLGSSPLGMLPLLELPGKAP